MCDANFEDNENNKIIENEEQKADSVFLGEEVCEKESFFERWRKRKKTRTEKTGDFLFVIGIILLILVAIINHCL